MLCAPNLVRIKRVGIEEREQASYGAHAGTSAARECVRAQRIAAAGELVDRCPNRCRVVDADSAIGQHVAQRLGRPRPQALPGA